MLVDVPLAPAAARTSLRHRRVVAAEVRCRLCGPSGRVEHANPRRLRLRQDKLPHVIDLSAQVRAVVYQNRQFERSLSALRCDPSRYFFCFRVARADDHIRLLKRGRSRIVRPEHRDNGRNGNFCRGTLLLRAHTIFAPKMNVAQRSGTASSVPGRMAIMWQILSQADASATRKRCYRMCGARRHDHSAIRGAQFHISGRQKSRRRALFS